MNWSQLRIAMQTCEQSPGQTIWDHCQSVHRHYHELGELLSCGIEDTKAKYKNFNWVLPDWFYQYEEDLAWNRHSSNIFYWYCCYHDCGKPFCLEYDQEGKKHFSNHAQRSYEIWHQVVKENPSENLYAEKVNIIGDLILHDMDLHTIKADQVDQMIMELGTKNVISLLLVALAEIHANAAMFGGFNSISFKIKYKQIDRRGRQICFKLFGGKT